MKVRFALPLALALLGCAEEKADRCLTGPASDCAQSCEALWDLGCRVGESRAECTSRCEAAMVGVSQATQERVLACYSAAESCEEVAGCSGACGAGDGPVTFHGVDAGEEVDASTSDAGGE